jgi:uncharacterized protein (DUF362 family)
MYITPGSWVVVKPNLVIHSYGDDPEGLIAVLTHGSVLRAVLDYVIIALKGSGKITVGDAPLRSTDFEVAARRSGITDAVRFAGAETPATIDVELIDFRQYVVRCDAYGTVETRTELPGDPAGYLAVDLGASSALVPLDKHFVRYRAPDYDRRETVKHQNPSRHEYLITGSALKPDTFIAVPKMKTHKRAGLTACLKLLVGINGEKSWVPHNRAGSVSEGGDEYPEYNRIRSLKSRLRELQITNPFLWRLIYRTAQLLPSGSGGQSGFESDYAHHASKSIAFGCWHGNDTIWRPILDLNRILLFADDSGTLCDTPQRKYFALVDGIISGEGEGPLVPTARQCGLLLAGDSAVAIDTVIARLMGFDPGKIPQLSEAWKLKDYPLCDFDAIHIRSNEARWEELLDGDDRGLQFEPSSGWKGHIELD